jgi:hypothetical protein
MVHPFGVGDVAENKEVIENTRQTKIKFSFVHFSTGSSTHSTGVLILPCLNETNKTAFDVWFYVLMIISSKSMVFFHHQNKCRHARGFEVSSL